MTDPRLHPEGAPGFGSNALRALLGDQQYEQTIERGTEQHETAMAYCRARTVLLHTASLVLLVVGLSLGVVLFTLAAAIHG